MIKKAFLGLIVVGLIAAAIFFIVDDSSAGKEEGPKTFPVERATIVDKALAVGRIDPEREIAVKSKISGLVREIYVEVGDRVAIGDPLFDVAPDPTPVEYADARRQVELAQVAYDNNLSDYNRQQTLLERGLISNQEFENTKRAHDEAELRLKIAREKLDLLETGSISMADREVSNIIRSTVAGTVLAIEVEEGDPVVPLTSFQAGTELMTIAQMDELIFVGNVDEIDVGKLSAGMDAQIEIGALPDSKIDGQLTRISPKAHTEQGSTLFEVEVTLDDVEGEFLRAGYSANAEIYITRRDSVISVPERLISITDSLTTVEVKDSLTDEVTVREITTGLSDGINIEVTSGLDLGELIVERPPREISGR